MQASKPTTDLVDELREWWAGNARTLPWRESRDPWAILVSEVMAQQTQVERVGPAWQRFCIRFPTAPAAAAAPVAAIVEEWAGLGYNRRAIHLHGAAVRITEVHAGQVPADLEDLLALPGVGPYTARAILVFAFERDAAVVDTNVGRVLARLAGRALSPAEAQNRADELTPSGDAWAWNQAMLDFGALVCTKREPDCRACPVRRRCRWAGTGVDPAVGSAAVGRGQSRFDGSDRQGRGRLVQALRSAPVPDAALAEVMGWPDDPDRARRVADGVIADGLARRTLGGLDLPQ